MISPCSFRTLFSRKVLRTKKNINHGILDTSRLKTKISELKLRNTIWLVRRITIEIFEQKRETRRQKESHSCEETEIELALVTWQADTLQGQGTVSTFREIVRLANFLDKNRGQVFFAWEKSKHSPPRALLQNKTNLCRRSLKGRLTL